jgi:iron complex transport system substrate-binding protein
MTISGSHIISEIISLCGGYNVFSEVKTLTPIIDMESIILKNPQAIISSGNTVLSEWVEFWKDWHVIDAVKQENIFLIPPDPLSRQTSRILDGAEYLCDYINLAR